MKNRLQYLLAAAMMIIACVSCNSENRTNSDNNPADHGFITISTENPSYFQYSDGTPYIPIGINLISPSGRYKNNPDSSLYDFGIWMKKLSDNGGNYIRVWLSSPFWDIEDQQAGKYSEEKAGRISRMIEMAGEYNLKIKMTLEHFRSLTLDENPQAWATKSIYHTLNGGPLDSIRQYIRSAEGQKLFIDKLDFYREHFGSNTQFFGWELWNEMNAMKGPADSIFFSWNEKMLGEVKKRFPENLVMQSLGSFDNDGVRPLYRKMMLLPGNELAQVHRYLDPGADLKVCQMPMDMICSSAVEELLSYKTGKPVILAETGAVESRHSGPSRYYPIDTAGMLLHDILFTPFFSGSAGAGMSWHWDSYVDKNNLWYHFHRFSEAVKNINPIIEKFIPLKFETDLFRIYLLKGEKTDLLWLRDKRNNWESELANSQPPVTITGINFDLKVFGINEPPSAVTIYDPWQDKWEKAEAKDSKISLPGFRRSLVIRITR